MSAAPFALAVVIQLAVPRASLLGHVAGILLGYPLAWGVLDGATPPLVVGTSACALYVEKIARGPNAENETPCAQNLEGADLSSSSLSLKEEDQGCVVF